MLLTEYVSFKKTSKWIKAGSSRTRGICTKHSLSFKYTCTLVDICIYPSPVGLGTHTFIFLPSSFLLIFMVFFSSSLLAVMQAAFLSRCLYIWYLCIIYLYMHGQCVHVYRISNIFCYHFIPNFWGHGLSLNLHFIGFSCLLPHCWNYGHVLTAWFFT